MIKHILAMALLALLLATIAPLATAATCQTVASFTPTCTGGTITQDTVSGTCRTIVCSSGSSNMKVSACDKPDGNSPQYFELYKQSVTGSAVSKVCLGSTCVSNNGFAKSATYTCGTPSPAPTPAPTPTPTPTPTTCAANVFTSPVTCTSTITSDVSGGCRTVTCGTGANTIKVQACNKNGGTSVELYRQAKTGTAPKVCFGSTCIQNEGFVKNAMCSTPAPTPAPTPTPTPTPTPSAFPLKTNIIVTTFWVGQGPSADTGWTNNYDSAWDTWWMEHYGGFDDPNNRNGWYPAGFTPKENPFYVAVPYTDYSYVGRKPDAFQVVPWANEKAQWGSQESMIKNRWIKIIKGSKTVYAQVENSGPGPTDDHAYVFGSNPQPTTAFGHLAGLDVSPAVRDYLTLGPVDTVSWQWVNAADVPNGPWKNIVTTRQSCWGSTMCP